jgi:hypothetical protein
MALGAVSGTGYNPTTAAKWVANVYAKRLDRLAYELSKLAKRVYEEEPLRGKLHIPKFDNLTVSSRSDSTDVVDPVFTANTEGEITVSPTYYDCNVSIDDRTISRMIFDPKGEIRTGIEMALAQQADIDIATLFSSLVANPVGDYSTDIDLGKVLYARSLVLRNAKEYARGDGDLILAYHTSQDDSVMGITNLTTWSARGDSSNAAKTGILGEAYGITFVPTTVIQAAGGGYANAMFIERGISHSYNIRPKSKLQEHGNAMWLLGQMDHGAAITRDTYSALVKSRAK